MKLKLRADKNDLIVFGVVSLFLLYIIALCILNINSLIQNGVPSGLNPIEAFFPRYIGATFGIWLAALAALVGSSSSYFFSFEKGFGYTSEKKEDGYSRWAKKNEIINSEKVEKVLYEEKDVKVGGIPLIYEKDAAYVDNSSYHTLVLGATGSGKTQTIVNPTVKMLMKSKESMIISDPKGEIYEDNYALLKSQGYRIIVLNFREPQKGNCWNPFHLPYKFQKEGNFDKANELLNDLSTNIVVDGQGQDPFWQDSASSYLTGLSLALFEDGKPDEININSINLMMTVGDDRFGASTYMKEYFNSKDPASPACVNALGTVNAPNETKGGIVSVLKQKVKTLAVTKNLSEMLSQNDFEMDEIGEAPTAVFMIIQDEKTTYHALATIFVKQCYESLISCAHKHGGQLPVRVNFLLDEFANMPKFKDITTMVTAARSRQIRFLFIIQNFAQIKEVYGDHDAETIRGNCGNLIYLLTGELSALEEISKLCGDKLVRVGKDKKEETRPLVTVSELQRMKQDEVILIRHRCPPFKTKMKMDWQSDFGFGKGADWYKKDVVYPTRDMQKINMFDIKEFVRRQKQQQMKPMNQGLPGFTPPAPSNPNFDFPKNNDFDIDQMIKDIDKKIAELEEEEKKEKEKKKEENKAKGIVKGSKNIEDEYEIIKPKLLDELPKKEEKKEIEKDDFNTEKEETVILNNEETNDFDVHNPVENNKVEEKKEDNVIDSKLINFDNFSVKDEQEEKEELENNNINTEKEEKESEKESDYDDFFDDFFYEE